MKNTAPPNQWSIFRNLTLLVLMSMVIGAPFAAASGPWDGSRTSPIHKLSLRDEEGLNIGPDIPNSMPFSVRQTCGSCHEYSTIASGLHFNSSKPGADSGRPGEPWVWVDVKTGTQIPLSNRDWPGLFKPADIGLSPWDFTLEFGRHSPGGDLGESGIHSDNSRWDLSGDLEINCLGCHNASHDQDMSEWAKQIGRQNLRWAATGASGLGTAGGMASRAPDFWSFSQGGNKDDNYFAVRPSVNYNQTLFDAKGRTNLDLVRKVQDKRCLHCHSASDTHQEQWQVDGDIHSLSGMMCVDCHRNGLDHAISRGYEGEAEETGIAAKADLSCEGCHQEGRLGAPKPLHKGLPVIHFEKMTCTACHSGPWPEDEQTRIRTSRANRLGIHGRAQWFTVAPQIIEPVFVKGTSGKLEPHRMMWPSYWARLDGDKVSPLKPDVVAEAGVGILDYQEEVGTILDALSQANLPGKPVFLADGKVYERNIDGGLKDVAYTGVATTSTIAWGRMLSERIDPLLSDFKINLSPFILKELALLPGEAEEIFEGLPLTEEEQKAFVDGLPRIVNNTKTKIPFLNALRGYKKKYLDKNPKDLDKEAADMAKLVLIKSFESKKKQIIAIASRKDFMPDEEAYLLEVLKAMAWNDKAEASIVAAYGNYMYRMGDDGNLETLKKPGPKATNITWGWLYSAEETNLSPDEAKTPAAEILGAPNAITKAQIAAVLQKLDDLNQGIDEYDGGPEAGYPIYSADGKVYRLDAKGDLAIAETSITAPKSNVPWAWMRDRGVAPLIGDFDPTSEEIDLEVDSQINKNVESLAKHPNAYHPDYLGVPVLAFGKKVYRRIDKDTLDITEQENNLESITLAWLKDGKVSPMIPDLGFTKRSVNALADVEEVLTEEQVGRVLVALKKAEDGQYAYISSGKMFRADEGGKVTASDHKAADPYSWAIGHDVRGAAQALGSGGCADCHAENAPFFFSKISALGPLKTASVASISMRDLQGTDAEVYIYTTQFFKWLIIITMTLLIAHIIADFIRRTIRKKD